MQATFTWKKNNQIWQIGDDKFSVTDDFEKKEDLFFIISPRLTTLYSGMQAGIFRCSYETFFVQDVSKFFVRNLV